MTDGPHRSLPMTRAWKRAAEALAKPAFWDDADEAVCKAVLKDFRKADGDRLVGNAKKIFAENPQRSLFDTQEENLEKLRNIATPNRWTESFIRSLRETGEIEKAVAHMFKVETLVGLQTVGDHYQRCREKGEIKQNDLGQLQQRSDLSAKQINFNELASRATAAKSVKRTRNKDDGDVGRTEKGPPAP